MSSSGLERADRAEIIPEAPPQRTRWRAVRNWFSRIWQDLRPGPEGRRGGLLALLLTIGWAVVVGAINLKSGFGLLPDFAFASTIAIIGVTMATLLVSLLLTIFRALPRLASGFSVATFGIVA